MQVAQTQLWYTGLLLHLLTFLPFIVHLILLSFNHICWNHSVETCIGEKPERWKLKSFVFPNEFYWTFLERKWKKKNTTCTDNILFQSCFPSCVSILNLAMIARILFWQSKCFSAVWVYVEKCFEKMWKTEFFEFPLFPQVLDDLCTFTLLPLEASLKNLTSHKGEYSVISANRWIIWQLEGKINFLAWFSLQHFLFFSYKVALH